MKTRKLELHCPTCGSGSVFYSCTPNCCFNHVCSDCGTTFEPATSLLKADRVAVEPPDPLPDASDPTVGCAKCESTAVYMANAGEMLVCAACGSTLALEYTEIAPA